MTDDETLVRAPRLTRLEFQGFKSFANRTVFAFEPGITAVVGPNGSGKSNVADAVRWVLGEQGQHALRARKSDDVIFTGGQGRAQAGLAEATLTFDNADGWLPIDFAEVSVTRRAFRSGENQYLINGRKVRLKDVSLLTAGLGQSHLVVGQGLVDAALSLRAEERRGLFEPTLRIWRVCGSKWPTPRKTLTSSEGNSRRGWRTCSSNSSHGCACWSARRGRRRSGRGYATACVSFKVEHYRTALSAAIAAHASAQAALDVAAATAAAACAEVDRHVAAGGARRHASGPQRGSGSRSTTSAAPRSRIACVARRTSVTSLRLASTPSPSGARIWTTRGPVSTSECKA